MQVFITVKMKFSKKGRFRSILIYIFVFIYQHVRQQLEILIFQFFYNQFKSSRSAANECVQIHR